MAAELAVRPSDGRAKLSRTVRKAVQVLDALAGSPADLGARDLAERTGLDRTTVYRLLETLVQTRLVTRDADTRRYRLGLHVLDYATSVLDGLDVRHVALSHLIDLHRELVLEPDGIERTIFVGVLDGSDVVLVETGWTRSVFSRLGGRMRFPAHTSAAGRCILAHMPRAELERCLSAVQLEARTPQTLTSRRDIERRLEQIRADGFDVSDREVFSDLRAIAVAVVGRSGTALGAIGLSVPAGSGSVEMLAERYAAKLTVAAQRTSMALWNRD